MTYFSERETGEVPRTKEEIGTEAWGGILTTIRSRIYDGSFACRFAEICPDGHGPYATDEKAFMTALRAEVPNLPMFIQREDVPSTVPILDMIEFCGRHAAQAIKRGKYHDFFQHYHLEFDLERGRESFREDMNRILRRNGLAYELNEEGAIERLAPIGLREALAHSTFATGDTDLDEMLEAARRKFLGPEEAGRREALEKLWDAWERLKTVEPGADKRAQINALLDRAARSPSSNFRSMLESEAAELTKIGNTFQIRHTETSQERLSCSYEVDYLFHRLFCLVRFLLHATGRGG